MLENILLWIVFCFSSEQGCTGCGQRPCSFQNNQGMRQETESAVSSSSSSPVGMVLEQSIGCTMPVSLQEVKGCHHIQVLFSLLHLEHKKPHFNLLSLKFKLIMCFDSWLGEDKNKHVHTLWIMKYSQTLWWVTSLMSQIKHSFSQNISRWYTFNGHKTIISC